MSGLRPTPPALPPRKPAGAAPHPEPHVASPPLGPSPPRAASRQQSPGAPAVGGGGGGGPGGPMGNYSPVPPPPPGVVPLQARLPALRGAYLRLQPPTLQFHPSASFVDIMTQLKKAGGQDEFVLRWVVLSGDRLYFYPYKHMTNALDSYQITRDSLVEAVPPELIECAFRVDKHIFIAGTYEESAVWLAMLQCFRSGADPSRVAREHDEKQLHNSLALKSVHIDRAPGHAYNHITRFVEKKTHQQFLDIFRKEYSMIMSSLRTHPSSLKEGFLIFIGEKVAFKGRHELLRYFVIDSKEQTLAYYQNKHDPQPEGAIVLTHCVVKANPDDPCELAISWPPRTDPQSGEPGETVASPRFGPVIGARGGGAASPPPPHSSSSPSGAVSPRNPFALRPNLFGSAQGSQSFSHASTSSSPSGSPRNRPAGGGGFGGGGAPPQRNITTSTLSASYSQTQMSQGGDSPAGGQASSDDDDDELSGGGGGSGRGGGGAGAEVSVSLAQSSKMDDIDLLTGPDPSVAPQPKWRPGSPVSAAEPGADETEPGMQQLPSFPAPAGSAPNPLSPLARAGMAVPHHGSFGGRPGSPNLGDSILANKNGGAGGAGPGGRSIMSGVRSPVGGAAPAPGGASFKPVIPPPRPAFAPGTIPVHPPTSPVGSRGSTFKPSLSPRPSIAPAAGGGGMGGQTMAQRRMVAPRGSVAWAADGIKLTPGMEGVHIYVLRAATAKEAGEWSLAIRSLTS